MRTAGHTSGRARSTRPGPGSVGRVRTADTTPGEISSAMRALRDAGLVENTGGEGLADERWRLTPRGEETLSASRPREERSA